MNDMLERLQHSQQQQNRFVADASHELRSPVAGILAQLDVAAQYPDRVDVGELLPKLHAEARRTQGIVEDLLYLSRLEGNDLPPPDYLSVAQAIDVVHSEVERHQALGSTPEVTLDQSQLVFDPTDTDGRLSLSQSQLGRVMQNLVGNAVRHSGGRIKVSLKVDPPKTRGRHLTVRVADDGPGISAQDRERIFDRFVRLDEARSRDQGGSGLGLSITQELVSRAGGTIAVVPATDESYSGANFEVRLPVASPTI